MQLRPRLYGFLAVALVVVAVGRIVSSYRRTGELFDEPCHVAAAMELLAQHTYKLDPVHPPLARLAMGLPLYLAGERYPQMNAEETAAANYDVVGNHVLYDSGHYIRNLMLARSAMLPFFIALSVLVFLWARKEFGTIAALSALALLTTTPIILALSSIAYTDLVAATTQFAAVFAFTKWLEQPSKRMTGLMGTAIGFALMSKMTSFVFLPIAALAIAAIRWARMREGSGLRLGLQCTKLIGAVGVALILLWGSYGFSTGHVREEFNLSVNSMPSFQHFPVVVRNLARSTVVNNWRIPAPALFHGFAETWVLNKTVSSTYMFGAVRESCWYFFLGGVFFKSPIPLLILCAVGLTFVVSRCRELNWSAFAPAIAAAAIFLVTLPVKYHAGMRHVLIVFPLLVIVAGAGVAHLLRVKGAAQTWARIALLMLLGWQGFETIRAQKDFIAYFKELGGSDPSRVMVTGCDLDCGQDIFRLADELRTRGISRLSLAIWSSADMQRAGLPSFEVLQPSTRVSGWIAISDRSLRLGDVLHESHGPYAYRWLENYRPLERVGQTIRLYYIPAVSASTDAPVDSAIAKWR
jgi:hypothetical protein